MKTLHFKCAFEIFLRQAKQWRCSANRNVLPLSIYRIAILLWTYKPEWGKAFILEFSSFAEIAFAENLRYAFSPTTSS